MKPSVYWTKTPARLCRSFSSSEEEDVKLACQEHILPDDNIIEKWEFAASAGFDGIELRGMRDWRERLEELRSARDRGVVFSSVCLIDDRFIGDFDAERRREAVEHMKSLLSGIAELGGEGAITPAAYGLASKRLPPFEVPRTEEEDRRVLLDALEELGEHAAGEGTLVLLEPLNRYEDHMLNRLDQVVELSKAAGRNSVKVMGDLFHMNIEEDDPAESIRRAGEYLAHVHLADSNRAQPGAGHNDFGSAFRALHDIGFDGYLAMECGIRGDARTVLPQIVRHLRALME
jgi:sugar phosphate isomerase/epimerase